MVMLTIVEMVMEKRTIVKVKMKRRRKMKRRFVWIVVSLLAFFGSWWPEKFFISQYCLMAFRGTSDIAISKPT